MQHFETGCFVHVFLQTLEPDLNYASLELKVAKKHRKKHRHNHAQGCNTLQELLTVHPPLAANSFLEADIDVDAQLPPASLMVSQSSIYLNTQQIAKETEDLGRGQSVNVEAEGLKWTNRDQDREERKNKKASSHGNDCTEAAEAAGRHGDTDHFSMSFNGV